MNKDDLTTDIIIGGTVAFFLMWAIICILIIAGSNAGNEVEASSNDILVSSAPACAFVETRHDMVCLFEQDSGHEKNDIFEEDLELTDIEILTNSYYPYYTKWYDPRNKSYNDIPLSREDQKFIFTCCLKYNIPYETIMGIFGAETNWNMNYGVSPSGKYCGIGMLHIQYNRDQMLKEIGVDILTPRGAAEASCYILSKKVQRFGSLKKAIIAYNLGDGGAQGVTETGYFRFVNMIANNLLMEE